MGEGRVFHVPGTVMRRTGLWWWWWWMVDAVEAVDAVDAVDVEVVVAERLCLCEIQLDTLAR